MNIHFSMLIMTLLAVLPASTGHADTARAEGVSAFYSNNSAQTQIQLQEDSSRKEWQKPQEVVERLSVKPGEIIADIGAGSGYFSVLFAQKVGKNGTVYAVDVDSSMVDYLKQRSIKEELANIKSILAKPDDPLLAKDSADLVFLCSTYMFISGRERYLLRLKDVLKQGGRLAIISYNLVDSPEGPPIHTRVSRETTIREVVKAGFVLDSEYFFLPYQHFLVFKKQLSNV